MNGFSLSRWLGILIKEFIQLRRDRLTFGMIIGVPILQLLLFGFAINSDPRHLPTAVVMADPGPVRPRLCRGDGQQRLLQDRRQRGRARSRPPAGPGRGAVRRHLPARFSPRPGARQAAHAAGRGRRHRPDGRRRRDLGAEPARRARLRPRPAGPAARAHAAGGPARAPPLQPRGPDRLQHRAGADGRDPDHDHGADDRAWP